MDTYYIITILDFRHRPIVTWSQPGKGKSSIILNNHTDMRSRLWIIFLPCLKELLHLCLPACCPCCPSIYPTLQEGRTAKADHAERPRVCARFSLVFVILEHLQEPSGIFRKYTFRSIWWRCHYCAVRAELSRHTEDSIHKQNLRFRTQTQNPVSPPRYYSESSFYKLVPCVGAFLGSALMLAATSRML